MNHEPNGAHACPDGRHGFMPQTPKTNVKTQMIQNQMFAVMVASYGPGGTQTGGYAGSGADAAGAQGGVHLTTVMFISYSSGMKPVGTAPTNAVAPKFTVTASPVPPVAKKAWSEPVSAPM